MINVIERTPIEYSNQSRDYQLLARLYSIVYNYNKMYADNMNFWGDDVDNKLTMLRAKTLNFSPKHSWDLDALDGVISCFKSIIRVKGTQTAIEFCVNVLLRLNNIPGKCYITIDRDIINIKIPDSLSNVGVVTDLLEYIVPAGLIYNIVPYKLINNNNATPASVYFDNVSHNEIDENLMGIFKQTYEWSGYEDQWGGYESSENMGYSLLHNSVVPQEEQEV